MRGNDIYRIRMLDRRFSLAKNTALVAAPSEGWIRTMRETLGMTTTQLAQRLGVSQSRVVQMEKNEANLKVSTLKKVAAALNCTFSYSFMPVKSIADIIDEQAQKKAELIVSDVSVNMALENQAVDTAYLLEDTKRELKERHIHSIWNE